MSPPRREPSPRRPRSRHRRIPAHPPAHRCPRFCDRDARRTRSAASNSAIQASVRPDARDLNEPGCNGEGPPERALVSIQASRGVGLSSRAGGCCGPDRRGSRRLSQSAGAQATVPRVAGEHGDETHRAALADRAAERALPEHFGERHRAPARPRHRRPAVVVPVRVVVEIDDVEADPLVVVDQPDLPPSVLVHVVGHRLGEAVAADRVPDLRVPTAVVVQVEPRDLVVAVEVRVDRGAVPAPVAVELPVLPARRGRRDARRRPERQVAATRAMPVR